MMTYFSSSENLVNNNDFKAENFTDNRFFKQFLRCKFSSFVCKKASNSFCKSLEISGVATTYNNSDITKDVLVSRAFEDQIDEKGSFKVIPHMYYEHNSNEPSPGFWTDVALMSIAGGIQVKGHVSSEKVISLIQQNKLSGLSIGFYIDRINEDQCNRDKNYRYIEKARLVEISLVANPANSKAYFAPTEVLYYGSHYDNFPSF